MELIDKSALVAEIEKLMNRYDSEYDENSTEVKAAKGNVCHKILCTIDTLEVKEVDFDSEWKKYFEYRGDVATVNIKHLAKHFFELGLKAQKGDK